ncbi:MAG: aldehyde dehydrogenase family protein, partial [Armatimonadetes bacterium]|nr:aldehyde dehydrogenase family protein [Armatimonadota bacterium]
MAYQRMFVGGEWVDSVTGEREQVLNPASAEVIAQVPRSSKEDVDRVVAGAKAAFASWSDSTPAER